MSLMQQGHEMSFTHSFLVAVLFSILLFVFLRHKKRKQPNLPPSPFKLPIVGNLHQLGSLPHRSLHALSKRHGPLMLLKLGPVPALVVSSADMAREIMSTHDLIFSSRPAISMAKQLMYGKDLAFAPYGEYWKQARKVCILHLLSTKRVKSFRSVREEEVALMIKKIQSSAMMGPVNLSEMIILLNNDITSRIAFGKKYILGAEGEDGGHRFRRLFREFLELLGAFHVGDYFPRLAWISKFNGMDERVEKNFKEWDDILGGIVKDHEDAKGDDDADADADADEGMIDFVDVLLQIRKDCTTGITLTQDHIKALVMDMFAAGTDTTYAILEWAMAELLTHPKVMKKVQEEVRERARGHSMIAEDDLVHMKYLKSVVKEALRLHPPLPLLVPRESMKDVKIQGYDIPAKTRVIVNAWTIGRDSKSWEQPEEFQPERFLSSSSHIDFTGHDFELIPFGAGRRGCPGIQFAIAKVELVLANLLYHFDWEMPNGATVEDLDMSESPGITVHKKSVLLLVAKPQSY
ncbi:cytochrome P450 71A1-like [Magnolia sinica]|uniref:cytochrome P450 71A1-like n=1 Tax=Magnolia sinica TaxID=86752 RepID=UPI002659F7D7|nr:cytochrome P450 71A1-like [Magnolia sinica]